MVLGDQKLHIVSGKGGVGKSSVAAAMAFRLAEKGKKVLLAELGENSFYAPFFQLKELDFKGQELRQNVQIAKWDWPDCLQDYVNHFIKIETLSRMFFKNRVMKNLMAIAPGLPELSVLGKATSHVRDVGPSMDYDTIVLDSYATGHTLSLVRAPLAMSESIGVGPMGVQAKAIHETLSNPEITSFTCVTTTEELPTVESIEFVQELLDEFGIHTQIVANRLLEPPCSLEEIQSVLNSQDQGLRDFSSYLEKSLQRQNKNLERLQTTSDKVAKCPLVLAGETKMQITERLSECFH